MQNTNNSTRTRHFFDSLHLAHYKVNLDLKRITRLKENVLEYLDYSANITNVLSLREVPLNEWKGVENNYYISKPFEWKSNGIEYTTSDNPVKWTKRNGDILTATVFHNGKIYTAAKSMGRVLLMRMENGKKTTKYTSQKYIRAFEIKK